MTHWDNQAKQWDLIGSPLKPSHCDIQNYISWVNEVIHTQDNSLSVLVLGVTPELINIPWPAHTTLLSVDYNTLMINSILPAQTPTIKPTGLLGNWLQLPLAHSSIDIVLGDGCHSQLAEKNYALLSKEIRRVLKPTGKFIIRFFTNPDENESIDLIHQDIFSGKIKNFHAFKLRLAMALQDGLHHGVCLKNIWECWNQRFKTDVQQLMHQSEWNNELTGTIDTYKNSETFYTFPTLEEIRSILGQDFIENEIFIPDYYLGRRCPTFKLTPIRQSYEFHSV